MLIGRYYMVLEINEAEESLGVEEPSDYVYEIAGKVVGLDEKCHRTQAGRFRAFYFDIQSCLDNGMSIFDLFDDKSETIDYFYALFDSDAEYAGFSERLCRFLSIEPYLGNVLILDRLEILPRFRSRNLGLIVMRRLIERFRAGAEIVAIKPFPLQAEAHVEGKEPWRARLKLADLDTNRQRATAKLRRHYAKLGFKEMKGSVFMFRFAKTPLPSIKDLEK